MKRFSFLPIVLVSLIWSGCDDADPAVDDEPANDTRDFSGVSKVETVAVCHQDDQTGEWKLLNLPPRAHDAHIRHGDADPGQPVPGMEGYTFDDACVPVADAGSGICPCFNAADLASVSWTGPLATGISRGYSFVETYNGFLAGASVDWNDELGERDCGFFIQAESDFRAESDLTVEEAEACADLLFDLALECTGDLCPAS